MPRERRPRPEPRILVVAEPGLLQRLQPLIPHARLMGSEPATLLADVARVGPRVVLCATEEAGAGLDALRRLKAARWGARVLFLTPPSAGAERLAALELGVDQALARPVDEPELAGRLSLMLRRSNAARVSRLPIGEDVELDLDRRELLREDRWVHLRPKEAGLLELLARSPGRTLSRAHILERVWGSDHEGDPRTVDVHVRWLRAKIEPDPRNPRRLLTVRGVGYRLEPEGLTER